MQELLTQFVPAADEVARLQRSETEEARLFQEIAEQGHYAGRTQPSRTRQGIYALAPSGVFLASINTRHGERVEAMLEKALARWDALPEAERYRNAPLANEHLSQRLERFYPEGGLALRVTTRDLPREKVTTGWRGKAWNLDYAWLRKHEARMLLPDVIEAGAPHEWPQELTNRIARSHMVDNVRGQVPSFGGENDEVTASMTSYLGPPADGQVSLHIQGTMRCMTPGRNAHEGGERPDGPEHRERGFETTLLGHATFDLEHQRFTTFDLVALGTRWGGSRYNGRDDDTEPAPVGVLFSLAPERERVAPALFWAYRW